MATHHSKESRLMTVFWQVLIVMVGFLLFNNRAYTKFTEGDLDVSGVLLVGMTGFILVAAGVGIMVRYYRSALGMTLFGLVFINLLFLAIFLDGPSSWELKHIIAACVISNSLLLGVLFLTRRVMKAKVEKPVPDWLANYYQTSRLKVITHWAILAIMALVFLAFTIFERIKFETFAHELVITHSTGVRQDPKHYTGGTTFRASGTDRLRFRYLFGAVSGMLRYQKDTLERVYVSYENPLFFLSKRLVLESELVVVADKNLEAAVRKALSKPDALLQASDLKALTSLDLPVFSISSLKGLERASNLVSLNASNNHIVHIGGLEKLSKLRHLNLFNNPLNNKTIAIVAQMKQLSELNLGATSVRFLTRLRNLKALTKLNLYNLYAVEESLDLELFKGLNKLEVLNLSRTGFINASLLTKFKALKTVELGDQADPDLVRELENAGLEVITAQTPVTSLSRDLHSLILKTLRIKNDFRGEPIPLYRSDLDLIVSLKGERIRNIAGIDACQNLVDLALPNSNFHDISPLRELTKLKRLDVSGGSVYDFSALKGLTALEYLDLSFGRDISDISPLQGLVQLKHLNLSHKKISNIEPLRPLSTLEYLNLAGNKIKNISALSKMTRLKTLHLQNNNIADISVVGRLESLEQANFRANGIKEIGSVLTLPQLKELDLAYNRIKRITGPESGNRPNLLVLDLEYNLVKDISALAAFSNITSLALGYNRVEDLAPLSNLTKLVRLDLKSNRLTDLTKLEDLRKLRWLNVTSNKTLKVGGPDEPGKTNDIVIHNLAKKGCRINY